MEKVLGGTEAVATALLLCGTIFGGLVTWRFVLRERYPSPWAALGPAERAWALREVEEELSRLAPRVLRLGEMEEMVELALRDGVGGGARTVIRERLRRVALGGFWGDFAGVSALAGEDPVRVLSELRGMERRLEGCLEEVEEVWRVLRVGQEGWRPGEGERHARG